MEATKFDNSDLPKFGEVITAQQVEYKKNKDQYTEFGMVLDKNGEPKAVPVSKLPADHFGETKPKRKTRAKKAPVETVAEAKPKRKAPAKTKAKAKKATPTKKAGTATVKMPKLVDAWPEIREAIRAGRKLKEIAEQYSVRYYDVYRVKVHGMEL